MFEEITLEAADTGLRAGDVVVFYTDGLTDLPPPNDRTEDELASFIVDIATPGRSAGDVADGIQARLLDERLGVPRNDDVALVVLVISDGSPRT